MIISLIVAMDEQGGIGQQNRLPWHLRADLQRFKKLSMGHHIIAGRKTFESIGGPLPGRVMIVLTRQTGYQAPGCLLAQNLPQALQLARSRGEDEVFVIGGEELYRQVLPIANRLYLTRVHATVDADVFFPDLDLLEWDLRQEAYFPADEQNDFAHTYRVYEKKTER